MGLITYSAVLPTVAGWYAHVDNIGDVPTIFRVTPQEDGSISARSPTGRGLNKVTDAPSLVTNENGFWFGPLADQALATVLDGAFITGSLAVGAATTDLASEVDDLYINAKLVPTSGNLVGETADVTDYDGTTKTLTWAPDFSEAPANADTFMLVIP